MTTLTKPVLRSVDVGSLMLRSDPLVITLHHKGFIGIREKGCRAQYKIDLKTVVACAVRNTTNKIVARAKQLRDEGLSRKQANKRARQECLANLG